MRKMSKAVALAAALSLPLVAGAALAQDAAPEPPHGATPGDASPSKGAMAPMKSGGAMTSKKTAMKPMTKKHK